MRLGSRMRDEVYVLIGVQAHIRRVGFTGGEGRLDVCGPIFWR